MVNSIDCHADGGYGGICVVNAWPAWPWLEVPSPRHICTRRTLLMQLTEQSERFSLARWSHIKCDAPAHIAQSDWQEKENKISLTKNHDFNTCNIYTEPKSCTNLLCARGVRSVTSQAPERIDSLDNNNPLKIYTKLTSTSACTLYDVHCTEHTDSLTVPRRRNERNDHRWSDNISIKRCGVLNMLMQRKCIVCHSANCDQSVAMNTAQCSVHKYNSFKMKRGVTTRRFHSGIFCFGKCDNIF